MDDLKVNPLALSLQIIGGLVLIFAILFGSVKVAEGLKPLNTEIAQTQHQKIIDWCDEVEAATNADEFDKSVKSTYTDIVNYYFGTCDVKDGVIRVNDTYTEYCIYNAYADTENETYTTKRKEIKTKLVASIRYLKDQMPTENQSETGEGETQG